MLEDLGGPLLIGRAADRESWPAALALSPFLAVEAPAGDEVGSAAPLLTGLAEAPAMIYFTSGSTGRPKGVVVPQPGIVRLVRETLYHCFGPDEVIAHVSNVSFDAALMEIWGALLNGGRIAVIGQDTLLSPERLAAAIAEQGITTTFQTAALFQHYVQAYPQLFDRLEVVLFGGDRTHPDTVRRLWRGKSGPALQRLRADRNRLLRAHPAGRRAGGGRRHGADRHADRLHRGLGARRPRPARAARRARRAGARRRRPGRGVSGAAGPSRPKNSCPTPSPAGPAPAST